MPGGAHVIAAMAEQRDPAVQEYADPADGSSGATPERRRELIAGRALVRWSIARLGAGSTAVRIVGGRGGRPELTGARPAWLRQVSLSHSGRWVAAALSDVPVGVDVQAAGPASDRLAARILGARADQPPGPGRDAAVAAAWVVQEACVKATGQGLAGRPWTIPVDPAADAGAWGDLRWRRLPVPCVAAAVAVIAVPTNRHSISRNRQGAQS